GAPAAHPRPGGGWLRCRGPGPAHRGPGRFAAEPGNAALRSVGPERRTLRLESVGWDVGRPTGGPIPGCSESGRPVSEQSVAERLRPGRLRVSGRTGPARSAPTGAVPDRLGPGRGGHRLRVRATRADARPEKKKSKLPLFITLGAVALVAVLVLVGFLVVGSVNKNNYGPDKVAEDYVAALNKGDFAAAEKIAASPRPEGTNVDLLSKEFTDASSAKIDKAKVESSTVDGDKGTV